MIAIKRPQEPIGLNSSRKAQALDEIRKIGNTNEYQRFRFFEDIVMPMAGYLKEIFRNRCAFCESTLAYMSKGEINHFRPYSGCRTGSGDDAKFLNLHYSWLAYEWNNLYLVCNDCNKHRRDYFPLSDESTRAVFFASWEDIEKEERLLVDPCLDDPSTHITFGADGFAVGITAKGLTTIDLYGLNREKLVELRRQSIEAFRHFYEQSRDNELTLEMEGYLKDLFDPQTRITFAGAIRAVSKHVINEIDGAKKKGAIKKARTADEISKGYLEMALPAEIPLEIPETVFKVERIKNFSIRTIELSNFKSITELTLDIASSVAGVSGEPWLLLLGDNGIGKSSILQAVALALCGQKELDKLGLSSKEYLRFGTKKGYVKVTSHESDEVITLEFNKTGFISSISESPTYILGYGSTRLLPKGSLKAPIRKKGLVNVSNLFNYSIALVDVNKWFKKLRRSQKGIEELELRILPALHDLLDMEEGFRLVYKPDGLHFERGLNNHLLDAVSDGFKSVIGLAVDIMMSLSGDIGGYHSTQGIVLVDELGNHLHPRWRMKIVTALRRAFPNLQFVVSTHEPLCLRGLAHGEVTVLLSKNDQLLKLDKTQLPDHNLLRVDQLLTSDLFGLINTLDEETEKKYEEYYRLLSIPDEQRTAVQQEQIRGYTQTLSKKELMGSSPKDQVLFEIVSETWGNKITQEGFKTVTELKEETISEVKEIIRDRKLNWL
jgi:predicted ATPase